MKKYELTDETIEFESRTLHRIRALVAFGDVVVGELGGFVEKESNLDQSGNAWVCGNARVCGNAQVCGNSSILWICPIGSRSDTTTFFACQDKRIRVVCGCFFGDLDEFEQKVRETHGDNRHAKVYQLAIEMAKAQIVFDAAVESIDDGMDE